MVGGVTIYATTYYGHVARVFRSRRPLPERRRDRYYAAVRPRPSNLMVRLLLGRLFAMAPTLLFTQQAPDAVFRGVPVATWLQRLQTERDTEALRQASIAGYGLASENAAVAARHSPLLRDRSVCVRRQAAWLLSGAGPTIVPGPVDALSDADEEVCENAARAIGRHGPAAAAAMPRLIQLLIRRGLEAD
ncbi:MAG: HEAT repeat domain-containing protein [Planctomycetes bacterium]|nr:HEAT repeat domain-containing protein [Planctomycetota bacterium]